ncbi:MAG: PIN domain-containing protein [Phycisphaeraceae bacterium]|nr:PIN domain-containing protein [Phycisphaeraceae bacterium]
MTLIDAGPLLALVNSRDRDHALCVEAISTIGDGLSTTWPVFAEAMHMAGERLGRAATRWRGQSMLWELVRRGDLTLHNLGMDANDRLFDLMKKYRDSPMDLGDATLVVLAEDLGTQRIFTLDSHFRAYRIRSRKSFRIVPADL